MAVKTKCIFSGVSFLGNVIFLIVFSCNWLWFNTDLEMMSSSYRDTVRQHGFLIHQDKISSVNNPPLKPACSGSLWPQGGATVHHPAVVTVTLLYFFSRSSVTNTQKMNCITHLEYASLYISGLYDLFLEYYVLYRFMDHFIQHTLESSVMNSLTGSLNMRSKRRVVLDD